jgi:Uma2 family endonuclease
MSYNPVGIRNEHRGRRLSMATVAPVQATPKSVSDVELAASTTLRLDAELYEYIAGEYFEVSPSSYDHSKFGARFAGRMEQHATDNDLGEVVGADIGILFRESPRLLLGPDAAFVQKDRLPPEDERQQFLRVVPDLVVEVVSPSDSHREVLAKVALYLELGVRLVWLVDPEAKTVTVYRIGRDPQVFTVADALDGEDVLPGFTFPVSVIFR